jgi:hypothetical protein
MIRRRADPGRQDRVGDQLGNVISLTEDYTPTDTDSDGDLDGAFARAPTATASA